MVPVKTIKLARIHVRGVVQGVGFRPFVYLLAQGHKLKGWVRNTSGNVEIEAALGRAYADGGDRAEATKALDHLRARMHDEYVSAAYVATLHIGLGEVDEAFAALAEAEAQHSYTVAWWKTDPDLDPVRSDPRFTALLQKVGLDK